MWWNWMLSGIFCNNPENIGNNELQWDEKVDEDNRHIVLQRIA
jgi:hypothetical protein